MLKRPFTTLALCVSCALLLAACGGYSSNSNNAPATNAPAANSNAGKAATNTAAPAATVAAAAAGDKIGVPECDDYLAKYETCVSTKVPAAARAQYESTMAQTRKSWRDLAANPQTKATLAQACKTATETARASMKQMGCEF
jgi:succinate dehydrogenase/fumarate reductase-like Fe-S protein